MPDRRICFDFVFGIEKDLVQEEQVNAALGEIDEKITRMVGGLTRMHGYGTWTEGTKQDDFSGKIERTQAFKYSVVALCDDDEEVYSQIKDVICAVAKKHKLPIHDVLVTWHECKERHFAVNE